jgi:hypothetical protein
VLTRTALSPKGERRLESRDRRVSRSCWHGSCSEWRMAKRYAVVLVRWRMQLAGIELHNRSREVRTSGTARAVRAASSSLPSSRRLTACLDPPPWGTSPGSGSTAIAPKCGHPTDAAIIRRLAASGWDEPMGPRPTRSQWPTPGPARVGRMSRQRSAILSGVPI